LLVLVLAVVVLGTGGNEEPATAAGATASPAESSLAAGPSATRRTPRPSASDVVAVVDETATPDATSTPRRSTSPTASTEPSAGAGTPLPGASPTATAAGSPRGSVASGRTYKVKKGDTLSEIAARFGTTVKVLQELNDIEDPRLLKIGQILKLP
jgi:LysM repeat protein